MVLHQPVDPTNSVWNILIVDEHEAGYRQTTALLNKVQGRQYETTWAASYEAGLHALSTRPYHAVLVDNQLGAHTGIELIREAGSQGYSSPLILFAGQHRLETDLEAMQAGVLYLAKEEATPQLLERMIRYAVQRTQNEQALQEGIEAQSARLETVLQALPVGVWITDASGRIVGKNEQADRIWAGSAPLLENIDQYPAYTAWNSQSGKQLTPEEYPMAIALQTGKPVAPIELRIQRFDGSEGFVLVTAQPILNSEGQVLGAVAINLDITEQKRVEKRLEESKENVFQVLENMSDGFFSFDQDWRITYVNQQAAEQGGQTPQEIAGRVVWEAQPKILGTDLEAAYRRVMETRKYEVVAFYSQSSGRWYEVRIQPTLNGISMFSTDITERKLAEEAFEHYTQELERSNQDLEEFAFVASHDLQEPLRKISGFGSSLRHQMGSQPVNADNQSIVEYLDRMQHASKRMQALIDGLLNLSRMNTYSNNFEPVNLTRLVKAAVADLELRIQSTGGRVEIETLPKIEADPIQMGQLFQNLIGNSLKFHRPNLPPVIRVSAKRLGSKQRNMVEIRVTDNGIGFEQQYAQMIFQPFKRLHGRSAYEGTGLGLAICQKIVDRHRGSIIVESIPGQGTTFIILLPRKQNSG